MEPGPKPPQAFEDFNRRFPKLGQAWDLLTEAGREGPLDDRAERLVKLAVAVGALREGAVRANVRKALAAGVTLAEVEQVIALAAPTIGMPSAVAVFTWVQDVLAKEKGAPG
jgi:alkylhydroperoxidase/carboxymuconolactone decarboxylase family protein YurZ